jgi:hypothetical protein
VTTGTGVRWVDSPRPPRAAYVRSLNRLSANWINRSASVASRRASRANSWLRSVSCCARRSNTCGSASSSSVGWSIRSHAVSKNRDYFNRPPTAWRLNTSPPHHRSSALPVDGSEGLMMTRTWCTASRPRSRSCCRSSAWCWRSRVPTVLGTWVNTRVHPCAVMSRRIALRTV